MAGTSNIEWTDATWNPIVGCSIVSPGCTNCYAMRDAWRKHHNPNTPHYRDLTKSVNGNAVWTGKFALAPDSILLAPLHWRKPRRIFVNSMGDLFHEDIPDEWIDNVFAVMSLAPQHTYQILTKRAKRMHDYIAARRARAPEWVNLPKIGANVLLPYEGGWPTYVWLGISAERQQEWDERKEHLRNTPAAVHFASFEPLLGGIVEPNIADYIQWAIVGGESGKDARPFCVEWADEIVAQCRDARVACFVKQFGTYPKSYGYALHLKSKKGGDPDEWPDRLRVREFPNTSQNERRVG